MNQILFNKEKNNKIKYIFKVQFIISIIVAIILIIFFLLNYKDEGKLEELSKIINKNIEITSFYDIQKTNIETSNYLGKIIIDKINIEYSVFKDMNEENLKISPCKFHGVEFGNMGNICIAGHNYNDNRFFGKINELELKDKIKLINLEGQEFEYIVFDKFETTDDDLSILKGSKNYELTLLTCNNSNKKRIIVKAYMKEY
jgi:LPXTG-site transpeptidase (sortase) family protein